MKQTNAQAALAGLTGAKGRNTAPAVTEGLDLNAPGEVESVSVSTLIEHPENKKYFQPLSADELEALKIDIQAHGIHDALIVTKENRDGVRVILAGHNRLRAAREIGLKFVPVRVKVFPDKAEETRFIIRDNLLRRQLTTEQKDHLVKEFLRNNPDMSSRAIGKLLSVHHSTVEAKRDELVSGGEISHPEKRTGSDGKKQAATKTKTAQTTPKQALINAQEAPRGAQIWKGGQVHPGHVTDAGKAFLELTTDYVKAVRKLRGVSKKDAEYALKKIRDTLESL